MQGVEIIVHLIPSLTSSLFGLFIGWRYGGALAVYIARRLGFKSFTLLATAYSAFPWFYTSFLHH